MLIVKMKDKIVATCTVSYIRPRIYPAADGSSVKASSKVK